MVKKRWFFIFALSLLTVVMTAALGLTVWATRLNNTIKTKLAGHRWAEPTEYFAAPEKVYKGQTPITQVLQDLLARSGYQNVLTQRLLRPGEYTFQQNIFTINLKNGLGYVLTISPEDQLVDIVTTDTKQSIDNLEFEPELFAQFYGGMPVLREIATIGDVPPHLLNAIMAAEDSAFLVHSGVSITGIIRATLRNIIKGHVSEGGSTLTQQLIKNYFLTPERTFKRKITEILMALLLESQFTKDDILQTYINEVYLGQEGPFEIHGVGTATKHYFHKSAGDLTIGESALLAGIIRGPNIYNPFTHPERALKRREHVLNRMFDLGLITKDEQQTAVQEPLPREKKRILKDLAPFFVDAVKWQLKKLGYENIEGLQVYTTLNMRAQQIATEAVINGVTQIENQYASFQKLKEKNPETRLQAILLSSEPQTGYVQAVVGGRSYSDTQLNRTVQSSRQVGSVFKPFVYLAAFSSKDETGNEYTPLTQVLDDPFTITYDKQTWSPQNYNNEYKGQIPLYKALEGSLNAATSKVALQAGIKKVLDVAQKAGIETETIPVPSVALGSATLIPLEVLQAYNTLDNMGLKVPLTFVTKVTSLQGDVLYEHKPDLEQVLDANDVRMTVSLMEGVIDRGTGKLIRAAGFDYPAAGKTGTTSDTKDAWFAGFTANHSAVVWIGFDQPQSTGLTGATGAIPIWLQYMKSYATQLPKEDFKTPEVVDLVFLDPESNMLMKPTCNQKIRLAFKKGTAPKTQCWLHP